MQSHAIRGCGYLAAALAAATFLAPTAGAHSGGSGGKPRFSPHTMAPGSAARAERGKYPKAPKIGTERTYVAWDMVRQHGYLKDFTLRGLSPHLEIWVASDADGVSRDLQFPDGDCRPPSATEIDDAQIKWALDTFETAIYPRASEVFWEPSPKDGKDAGVDKWWPGIPSSAYKGEPGRVIALIDNIRDENFYEPQNDPFPILGFVSSAFGRMYDRHMFVLDGAWWDYLAGPDRLRDPLAMDPCDGPGSITMDFVMAHEYNHTLAKDRDLSETGWLSEGMADWAAGDTGLLDRKGPGRANGHINCFLGNMPLCPGGPENSLTNFDEQDIAIHAEYGAAATFMETFHGRVGDAGMRALLGDPRDGLESARAVLADRGIPATDQDLLQDWSASMTLDALLDDGAAIVGASPERLQAPELHARVNLENQLSYARPGVRPNGSDFVKLRDADGKRLALSDIDSIHFQGPAYLPASPPRWQVDEAGHGTGNPALYEGGEPNDDSAIVRSVVVPTVDPTMTFQTRYDIEPLWDFGFVQVSRDGGRSYQTLPATTTTADHEGEAEPRIVANLPGFTGNSNGWTEQRVDLSAYAGQEVAIAFRYMTDPLVNNPGWWIDEVKLGGTPLSDGSTLEGWKSREDLQPVRVAGMRVRLLGHSADGARAFVKDLSLDASFDGMISGAELRAGMPAAVETVAAIVSYYEPTETELRAAPYVLAVNGVRQPGG